MIESIGVPHTEVGEIIVNGDCVDNTIGVYDQYDILVTQITNFKHLLDKDHRYYNKIPDLYQLQSDILERFKLQAFERILG